MSFQRTPAKEIWLNGGDKAIISRRLDPGRNDWEAERKAAEVLGATVETELPRGLLVRLPASAPRLAAEPELRIKILPEPDILTIGTYRIDTARLSVTPKVPLALMVEDRLDSGWMHHLVQLIAPPTSQWVSQIEQCGVKVVEPVSNYGLYVYGSAVARECLEQLPFVAWTGPFQPAYRIGPGIFERQGQRSLDVTIYPVEDVDAVRAAIRAWGGMIVNEDVPPPDDGPTYATLTARFADLESAAVIELARIASVRWLELAHDEINPDGELAAVIASGVRPLAPVYQAWLQQQELSGAGVTIAIADSGVDRNAHNNHLGHQDLRGRQEAFDPYTTDPDSRDPTGHGTLVASIALGNATVIELDTNPPPGYLLGQGVAPAAKYVTQNVMAAPHEKPPVHEIARKAASLKAQILNLSINYGMPTESPPPDYLTKVAKVDKAVRNPLRTRASTSEMVIVGAAGNFGPDSGTISLPKEAKNIITVGASCTLPDHGLCARGVYHLSSRGPAQDGRILPTVVAPGTVVTGAAVEGLGPSETPSGLYNWDSGTSYAAPVVSGMCALLIEWWRARHDNVAPSAAMLKALLINGAVDLKVGSLQDHGPATRIPNNHQGWGMVNLRNILDAPLECVTGSDRGPRLTFDQVSPLSRNSDEFVVVVEPCLSHQPLRITLVWTDAPGDYSGPSALRNDLDLEVRGLASGVHYVGNHFENGFSVPYGPAESVAPDRINNVECVYVELPDDQYSIRVVADTLRQNARYPHDSQGWQDFALVIDNAVQIQD